MQHIIDPKIISIFLQKPEEGAEVSEYIQKYQAKVASITAASVYDFLKSQNMSDVEINVELKKLVEQSDEPPAFIDPEVMERIAKQIEDLNEQIYKYYEATLTREQKDLANEYIDTTLQQAEENFEKLKGELLTELDRIEQEVTVGADSTN